MSKLDVVNWLLQKAAGSLGARSVEEATEAAARAAGGIKPIKGLPTKPLQLEEGYNFVPGPNARVHAAAQEYMARARLPYEPMRTYQPVDVERASAIAKAFEEMKHSPSDPKVKSSYDALIDETLAQLEAVKNTGLKIEWIKPGMKDPYASTPRMAANDVIENNHLWTFPTEGGFGTKGVDPTKHPMLRPTGETIDGHPLLANDAFRIVHDYFGHFKHGLGFRAAGEENAWRAHSGMYSDRARPAMTAETRGQNSWLNYGPYGDFNRKANAADTVYAEQKTGMLPDWVMSAGRYDPMLSQLFGQK